MRSIENCLHDRCRIGTGVGVDVLCDRFKILNRAVTMLLGEPFTKPLLDFFWRN